MERPVREIDPGVFLCEENCGRLLGFAEQFRLGLGHGQINVSATLALRRNRTLRVRPACEYEKGSPKGAFRTHGGSRTHDPLLRRQLLYPTELRERTSL